ncbi:hypothetical protein DOTSEDRAFT_87811 [Dothistroma septosporum NZE10]|uniref:Uncharacterized protein n=1 Tax=Dothistroma septosporum (strain NZE10 / CBS 128990) TaxID=675120 RepID=N1PQ00_DOTSN|nr:hypothetical protein DOTSEDRAFT_87811 [Dothistroma septosporum NZE10]
MSTTEALAKIDTVGPPQKPLAERDKRLEYGGGINQYSLIEEDAIFGHWLNDPWVEPGFTRDSVSEEVDALITSGGYGAQLIAVRLIEAGFKNFRIARAKELLKHSEMIGRKYGLYDRTLFRTETHDLRWNADTATWCVKTSRNDSIQARFVAPAAGPLHRPKLPVAPGIEKFKGHCFHSSRWDYDYTKGDSKGSLTGLADNRVAVVGTGATAVQIVPNVAKYAKELYVFQRTPSSIDVRGNRPTDQAWAKSLQPGWQKERMENFNTTVNGGILPTDLVHYGWTDILRKLLARGASEATDPARAAADRQMADFEKMNQVRARCDDVLATEWSHRTNMKAYGRDGQSVTNSWKERVSTLHGWTSLHIVQAALTPNFIHVTGEQAKHLAYVISEGMKRTTRTIKPTAEAQKKLVDTIVELVKLRAAFLQECTPGYYRDEGSILPRAATNASYGGGSPAFKILNDCRANGKPEGLDINCFDS